MAARRPCRAGTSQESARSNSGRKNEGTEAMGAVVVVGAQWGDEGKGKIVDIYSRHADVIVRYAGGANAGHTLVVDGDKVVFRLIPSGALNPKTQCVLGQGTVIDPQVLVTELE